MCDGWLVQLRIREMRLNLGNMIRIRTHLPHLYGFSSLLSIASPRPNLFYL